MKEVNSLIDVFMFKAYQVRIVFFVCLCLQNMMLFADTTNNIKVLNRHIIILVDESAGGQSAAIGTSIIEMLTNGVTSTNECSFAPVNLATDEVSLYTFGLTEENWAKIRNGVREGRIQSSSYFDVVSKLLIYRRESLSESKKNLSDFCKENVMPLFDGRDALHLQMFNTDNPGPITLSQYSQECLISQFAAKYPAKEYILIEVSDYKSGIYDKHSSSDRDLIIDLAGENNEGEKSRIFTNAFEKQQQAILEGLNVIRLFNIRKGDVIADIRRVIPEALIGTSAYVATGIQLEQKEYLGTKYDISNITIAFPHTSGMVSVDKIIMDIDNNNKNHISVALAQNKEEAESLYDSVKQSYIVPTLRDTDIKTPFNKGALTLSFTLLGSTYNKGGKDLLPFAFEAKQTIEYTSQISKKAPDMFYLAAAIIFLLLVLIFYFWNKKRRYQRGLNAPAKLEINVWPISNSRYMNVQNQQVIDYDCWYWLGENDKHRNIQITGQIFYDIPSNAKKFYPRIEYQINDVDQNPDFSFRPDGKDSEGLLQKRDEWYTLKKVNDDGSFEIICSAYLANDKTVPNFDSDNILKMKVIIRLSLIDENGVVVASQKALSEKYYSFIVKPEVKNSSLWMAFDSGTSGSCVAYGLGGTPDRTDTIHMAQNLYQSIDGNWHKTCIFPSKIRITDDSAIFDGEMVEDAKEYKNGKGDFFFGNEAEMFEGANSFQSIKKLLGYTNMQEIIAKGKRRAISGGDLAHLLIKGLCNHFEEYIISNEEPGADIVRNLFYGGDYKKENACFEPSRAIVAVPNNYTMVKIQAMVDSVKRTKLFKEVHYIYESEGVLMTYLQRNWASLSSIANKLIVVFDMGGATINATAFRLNVTTGTNQGHIYTRNVEVRTVSKIGFCVGGDDIDFALIKLLLSAPGIKDKIAEKGSEKEFMRKHKKGLIQMVRRLKLYHIDLFNNPDNLSSDNVLASEDTFWAFVNTTFDKWGVALEEEKKGELWKYINQQRRTHTILQKYVMNKVADSVMELFNGLKEKNISSCEVELILSGRSTLYPGIKECVIDSINKTKKYICKSEWKGFTKPNGELDEILVKSCVANGACWYAMFSKYITMRHDILTSTFGYLDIIDNKTRFVPILERNKEYDENGKCKLEKPIKPINPTLNNVEFIQMFGSDYDKIIDEDIRYKQVRLLQILPDKIHSEIKGINILVDNRNNFSYCLDIAGMEPIKGSYEVSDADIEDENSEAYSFAALQSTDDDSITTVKKPKVRF